MELFRNGDLVYHVLTPKYRDASTAVLARAFMTEPVVFSLGEKDPTYRTKLFEWFEFVDFWQDHCTTNGLSVVCIDERNHKVAGVFLVRDFFYFPDGFLETYSKEEKKLTPWMQFLLHLDKSAQAVYQPLAEAKNGDAVDLWFLGVDPNYRGRKIANDLMRLTLPLVKSAGFKIATIEATSAFTSAAALFNSFTAVVDIKSQDFMWQGKSLYTAPPPHGTWTFWIKEL